MKTSLKHLLTVLIFICLLTIPVSGRAENLDEIIIETYYFSFDENGNLVSETEIQPRFSIISSISGSLYLTSDSVCISASMSTQTNMATYCRITATIQKNYDDWKEYRATGTTNCGIVTSCGKASGTNAYRLKVVAYASKGSNTETSSPYYTGSKIG